ncbi:MAG: hypothetical protein Q9218_003898 [Villophora microphyllina]
MNSTAPGVQACRGFTRDFNSTLVKNRNIYDVRQSDISRDLLDAQRVEVPVPGDTLETMQFRIPIILPPGEYSGWEATYAVRLEEQMAYVKARMASLKISEPAIVRQPKDSKNLQMFGSVTRARFSSQLHNKGMGSMKEGNVEEENKEANSREADILKEEIII